MNTAANGKGSARRPTDWSLFAPHYDAIPKLPEFACSVCGDTVAKPKWTLWRGRVFCCRECYGMKDRTHNV